MIASDAFPGHFTRMLGRRNPERIGGLSYQAVLLGHASRTSHQPSWDVGGNWGGSDPSKASTRAEIENRCERRNDASGSCFAALLLLSWAWPPQRASDTNALT
jgi:hypothetical protein